MADKQLCRRIISDIFYDGKPQDLYIPDAVAVKIIGTRFDLNDKERGVFECYYGIHSDPLGFRDCEANRMTLKNAQRNYARALTQKHGVNIKSLSMTRDELINTVTELQRRLASVAQISTEALFEFTDIPLQGNGQDVSDAILFTRLCDIGLSTKTLNTLRRYDIFYIKDVYTATEESLLRKHNIGVGMIEELREHLAPYGITIPKK
ncbi:MAG: DNA-directed RNA polymerase subunit alpha C-terminal domain-containing protein [Candidatus Nanosyncoccaceae bacterium]